MNRRLSRWRRAVSEHFREVRERDTKWILQFDVRHLNRLLYPLLVALIALEFADVLLTLAALSAGPPLVELNPIASAFFRKEFLGFVSALALKYAPVAVIAYLALVSDWPSRPVRIRVVKLGVFVAMVASILVFSAIVVNNALNLFVYAHLVSG